MDGSSLTTCKIVITSTQLTQSNSTMAPRSLRQTVTPSATQQRTPQSEEIHHQGPAKSHVPSHHAVQHPFQVQHWATKDTRRLQRSGHGGDRTCSGRCRYSRSTFGALTSNRAIRRCCPASSDYHCPIAHHSTATQMEGDACVASQPRHIFALYKHSQKRFYFLWGEEQESHQNSTLHCAMCPSMLCF
ncbi:hypothetical protein BCR44DRAFT_1429302 [Catenaria anguillulae PL171]|uniref:Uncharacterized protein n=1 Tax=Catenaria anguillulae PL171 TaxID=765915 RepID=A0A1Y2H3R3_9FUNG|nr:hypothetical protein BCR44DRAFT_1454191 [Catenaria anguillulae PL171]ORZ37942.1 hypothetical protein BCR44DRAFT_1429302 [Catenaria anguillulae PL171]